MIVAYSAIFGDSDSIKPAPPADRCVLFTDRVVTEAHGWTVVDYRDTGFRTEDKDGNKIRPRVMARTLKLSPMDLFPTADASVWVDGSIAITDWPRLVSECATWEAASFRHPDRDTCYAEAATVIRLQIAHPTKINAAVEYYKAAGFDPSTLSTTGLFYREHNRRVREFCAHWKEHLRRYGTNDQVHVDFCAWLATINIFHLTGHYRDNPYAVYDGTDHRRRRKPQFKLEAECPDDYLA